MRFALSRLEHRYLSPHEPLSRLGRPAIADGLVAEINPHYLKLVYRGASPMNKGFSVIASFLLGLPIIGMCIFIAATLVTNLHAGRFDPFFIGAFVVLAGLLCPFVAYLLAQFGRPYVCIYLDRKGQRIVGGAVHGFRFKGWTAMRWSTANAAMVRSRTRVDGIEYTHTHLRLYETLPASDAAPWIPLYGGAVGQEDCERFWSFVVRYMNGKPEGLPGVRLAETRSTAARQRLEAAMDMFQPLLDARGAPRHRYFFLLTPVLAVSALFTYFPSALGRWVERHSADPEPPADLRMGLTPPAVDTPNPYRAELPESGPNVFEGPWRRWLHVLHTFFVISSLLVYIALGSGLLLMILLASRAEA